MSGSSELKKILIGGFSEDLLLRLLPRPVSESGPTNPSVAVQGKHILITGGGGSVGLALAQHILSFSPARLVLLNHSETAVLATRNLSSKGCSATVCEVVLGNCGSGTCLENLCSRESFDTIFHAAAYKHLDALESDPLAAITNNVMGAWHCLTVAAGAGVKRFVLVSSDKAFQPSSVLGESKYLANEAWWQEML